MQAYKVVNIILLVFTVSVLVLRVLSMSLLDRYPNSKAAQTFAKATIWASSGPGIALAALAYPIELLFGVETAATSLILAFAVLKTASNKEHPERSSWNLAVMVGMGWALISFIGSVASVDAACVTHSGKQVCRGSQGTPFKVGNSTYVLDSSIGFSFSSDASNNLYKQWTASEGDTVDGTYSCYDGVNKPDADVLFTDSYEVSTRFAGTFTQGYIPARTCRGEGNGFGIGATVNFPACPVLGVTASYVHTWVTVQCPAERLAVSNTPIWGITRVLVNNLRSHYILEGALPYRQYSICDIDTLICTQIPVSSTGTYSAYFDQHGALTTGLTAQSTAWLYWIDQNAGVPMPEIRCSDSGVCGVSSSAGATCPGVIQVISQAELGNASWDYTRPYLPLNPQFIDNNIAEFSARCQQEDAGLTSEGTGMQPLFYSSVQSGSAACTPESFETVPFTTGEACSFGTGPGPALSCPAVPSGSYTLTALGVNSTAENCTINSVNYTQGCRFTNSSCGMFVTCPGGLAPTLPVSQSDFSNMYPGQGLCKIEYTSSNNTCVTYKVLNAPCYVAGLKLHYANATGLYTQCPPMQGTGTVYGSNGAIEVYFNWTSGRRENKYNWSTNITTGPPPPRYGFSEPCTWECDGEIICKICEGGTSNFCKKYKDALSYAGTCSADFWFKGAEVLLLRFLLYSAIALISIAIIVATVKMCAKRYKRI